MFHLTKEQLANAIRDKRVRPLPPVVIDAQELERQLKRQRDSENFSRKLSIASKNANKPQTLISKG
jgi:hypothetical protein